MKQRAGGSREGTGSRDAAGEQRREQMLRAALDVIVERGYADTRIADVAERTGTSPALVIYYFKTRDQLLTEAIRYSEDTWYAEYLRRMETIPTAAGRLTELIGMNCLPGTDPEPHSYWLLWLDLWALSPRNPGVAAVREKSDERWREAIRSIVLAGQEAGEFAPVDADDFTITLSALLDGLAVQIALDDPAVPPQRTYDLAMRFAAGQLGFDWEPAPAGRRAAQTRFVAGGRRRRGGAVAGGSIELSGLTKRFSEIAVDNIDLTVASGEFFSLLGPVGLRQDHHPAADRRLRAADLRPDPARRRGRVRRAAAPAQRQHGVPELRAVPVPRPSSTTWRSGCGTREWARPTCKRRVDEALDLVEMTVVRQAAAGPAIRRAAAAGRAGPRAGAQPGRAAARRAARRARREAAPLAQDRAEGAAGARRHHLPLRHPRPGGGADHVPTGWR